MSDRVTVDLTGQNLLSHPFLNKGLAFTEKERRTFGLHGLLPRGILSLEQQLESAEALIDSFPSAFARHVFLRSLQDTNETLFYALLMRHLEAMLPIIYTPTVGEACQRLSEIWQRPRGIFLSYPDRDQMDVILANPAFDQVRVIVVTDGERILGLGDQGAGGMGIPIGKLSLYTVCAGIPPHQTLPVLLDTGTNNQALLQNPGYIGWRHERVRGADYDAFIEQFVNAVKTRWPSAILHWEDFSGKNAAPLLEKYRNYLCSFNDDIQGTAAVTAGAILAANATHGGDLKDETIVIVGAGAAGVGIGALLLKIMEEEGATRAQAQERVFMLNSRGLLTDTSETITPDQQPFAKKNWTHDTVDLEKIVRAAGATILIGVSGVHGLFTEAVIRQMAENCPRPIIFPLSNPTSHCEATPEDILNWSGGRALFSTGSPFPPLEIEGTLQRVDQTNNAYIFPGLGLGVLAVEAPCITDSMLLAAARGLASLSPMRTHPTGNILPPVRQLQHVSMVVAKAVAAVAINEKICAPLTDAELHERLESLMWTPTYRNDEKI